MSIVTKNDYWEDMAQRGRMQAQTRPQYAIVKSLTPEGRPVIQFMGDDAPSQKLYLYLKSYIPEQGDVVMLIDNVIQGGWRPNA